jgi:glycosyltransferase involved in cell wall biosynthesis
MDGPVVSFVVPVYNAEMYLRECLDSLVNQTIEPKEIILVNDGSTDGSLALCLEYAGNHECVSVVSQANRGQSAARNCGLRRARGLYVQFVDADDFLTIDSAERLVSVCQAGDLVMARGKYHVYLDEERKDLTSNDLDRLSFVNSPISCANYLRLSIQSGTYEVTPILGPILRQFLLRNGLLFHEGAVMEDHEFTLKLQTVEPDALLIQLDFDFYTYRRRSGSTTTSATLKQVVDIVENYGRMYRYMQSRNIQLEQRRNGLRAASALMYQGTSIYGRLSRSEKNSAIRILPRWMLRESIRFPFDSRQRFKIILFAYARFIVDGVYRIKPSGTRAPRRVELEWLRVMGFWARTLLTVSGVSRGCMSL